MQRQFETERLRFGVRLPPVHPRTASAQSLLIIVLFCIVFFKGFISEWILGVSYYTTGEADSPIARLVIEAVVVLNVGWLLLNNKVRFPAASAWFILYVAWSMLSAAVTGDTAYEGFKYARYTLYAGMVYFVAWNAGFSRRELSRINRFIAALFLIQPTAALFWVLILGQRTEWRVGTMAVNGGTMAAIFPLVAIGYAMGYYLYVRRSAWILLAGIAFGVVGYASGKRAIYFLIPACISVNLLLHYALIGRLHQRVPAARLLLHLSACAVISVPVAIYGISQSQGIALAEGNSVSVLEVLQHALDFACQYEFQQGRQGYTMGRSAASAQVIESLSSANVNSLLFGGGPSVLSSARGYHLFGPLNVIYGFVGWSWDALGIGLPPVIFFALSYGLVFRSVFVRIRAKRLGRVWRALAFGTLAGLVVLLYSYFFYASLDPVLTFTVLYYAAILASPSYTTQLAPEEPARYSRIGCSREIHAIAGHRPWAARLSD